MVCWSCGSREASFWAEAGRSHTAAALLALDTLLPSSSSVCLSPYISGGAVSASMLMVSKTPGFIYSDLKCILQSSDLFGIHDFEAVEMIFLTKHSKCEPDTIIAESSVTVHHTHEDSSFQIQSGSFIPSFIRSYCFSCRQNKSGSAVQHLNFTDV